MYKLFIVEDDRNIAAGIRSLAESWDLEVCLCEDFRRVTETFAALAPHIVLLDIGLPFFNGYHWCAELRKISSVPIIFISSAAVSALIWALRWLQNRPSKRVLQCF